MQKRLDFKQRVLVAGTLFGMFFGAGNLIFPVHLGQLAGRSVLPAMIGFIITAVGIPILGVAAIGITHSDGLQSLSTKVGEGYSYCFTCLLYLTIGPFFAIPRCATTSFTTGIQPMLKEGTNSAPLLLIFSACFFALVLFFSLRPAGITVWIGKIINPLFLLFLAVLVFTALSRPAASASAIEPAAAYQTGALFSGFVEGYGTMDAIAGLAFGILVIDIVRSMGVTDDTAIAKDVLQSGILTGLLMAVIYMLTILMGAQSRGLFETSENGGIALAQIAGHYLGSFGSLVLAFTVTLACLKTSIGLVSSCAEAFTRMFPKTLSYKAWTILFTAFSFGVSNFGLSTILDYSLPVLMFLYPPTITLILLALAGKLFDHDRVVYVCVTALTLAAAVFDLLKTLPAALKQGLHLEGLISFADRFLPFYGINLGWVVPAMVGLMIGLALRALRKGAAA
ncbi:MAG: branched-chain amino acid transport system II carrier protein [Clostridia bacterium]|nr:branched-chain amino acid transport system II carrier protein [Clostridia bacterium]